MDQIDQETFLTLEMKRLTSIFSKTDRSLIDTKDEILLALMDSIHVSLLVDCLDGETVAGMLGHAYAAGRQRGRKESAMREILEGSEDSECG